MFAMGKAEKLTDQIMEKIRNLNVRVKREDVLKRMKLLVDEFKVPESEAVRTIMNYLVREYGISKEELFVREAPLVKIADIVKPNQWISIKAKVVQLRDPSSPSISQVGLIGDETGIIKFVAWTKSGVEQQLEEGKCDRIENLVVHEFGERYQVNINRNTVITPIEKEIQLPEHTIETIAVMTKILSNSGLIRRCPECNRVIKDVCPTHGKVKPVDDLRVKAVFDDIAINPRAVIRPKRTKNAPTLKLGEELARAVKMRIFGPGVEEGLVKPTSAERLFALRRAAMLRRIRAALEE